MAGGRTLSTGQIAAYHRDGYLLLPGFFSPEEIAPCREAIARDPSIGGRLFHVHDGYGETREGRDGYRLDYVGWFRDGDDWLGTCTRLARIVEGAAALIGEAVYHYHSKLVRKPRGGSGTLVWHQDFGGWYQDGCVLPDMLTCVVALTGADANSGCLRLLKGSHRMGRVDRVRDEHTYAIDFNAFDAPVDADRWYDTEVLKTAVEDIARIHMGAYALRAEEGVFEVEGLGEDEESDAEAVRKLVERVSGAAFRDVLGEDAEALFDAGERVLEYTIELKEGASVTHTVASPEEGDHYILKSSARPHYFEVDRERFDELRDTERSQLVMAAAEDAGSG